MAHEVLLSQIGALTQETLRLLAAAHVLLWCSSPRRSAAAVDLLAMACAHAAACADQVEQLLPAHDELVSALIQALRALAEQGAVELAERPRSQLYSRLRHAYDAAGVLLPCAEALVAGREH